MCYTICIDEYSTGTVQDITRIVNNLVLPFGITMLNGELTNLIGAKLGTVNNIDISTVSVNTPYITDMLNCLIPQYNSDISYFSLQVDSPNSPANCYAYSMLVSMAVLSHYDDYSNFAISTQQANQTLNMLKCM